MDFHRIIATDPELRDGLRQVKTDPDTIFPILIAKIKLTWRCNLRCRACGIWAIGEAHGHEPEPLTTDLLKDVLAYLHGQGLKKLHFSGGEVLLRPDLAEIIRFARSLDLQVNLTTNGTLLGKEEARYLVEHRVHTVVFSIDGATRRKHDDFRGMEGAWNMTWKGIERLRNRRDVKGRGPRIAVNTVVTKKNADSLPDLFEVLQARGVENWRLLPVRTGDKDLWPTARQWARLASVCSQWEPLLQPGSLPRRFAETSRLPIRGRYAGQAFGGAFCYVPKFAVFIDANGDVYPCCTGRRDMPAYGNIIRSSIERVNRSVARREICSGIASRHFFDTCGSCFEYLEENEAASKLAAKEAPKCR